MSETVFILPIRNKENLIKPLTDKIIGKIKKLIQEEKISETSCLLMIDNSSKDNSWYEIGKVVARNPYIARAKKLQYNTKTSIILKNVSGIIIDFDSDIEDCINKKPSKFFIKDIFKSSKYSVIDEFQ